MGHILTPKDKEMLKVAEEIAKGSPDLHTKVGCVILAENRDHAQGGFNRFPEGLPMTIDRLQRPEKYKRMMHAEELAIMQALYLSYPLQGATLYSTQIPCASLCALMIIETGIKRVVTKPFPIIALQKWTDDLALVTEMFGESDVDLIIEDSPTQIQ